MIFKTLKPILFTLGAIGLFVSYIQPTFTEIRAIQDETNDYAEAVSKASQFNRLVSDLVDRQNSFSLQQLERLETFVPDTVDETVVMSALEGVVLQNNMILTAVQAGDWQPPAEPLAAGGGVTGLITAEEQAALDGPNAFQRPVTVPAYNTKDFDISVSGTYEEFKALLLDLERSLVLLEIQSLSLKATDTDPAATLDNAEQEFSLILRVHAINPDITS